MKFEEVIKKISDGKIVCLESKPELFAFINLDMCKIKPGITYKPISVYNTKTQKFKNYHFIEEMTSDNEMFSAEDFKSNNWTFENPTNSHSCKIVADSLTENNTVYDLLEKINSINKNTTQLIEEQEFSPKDNVFYYSVTNQLENIYIALLKILMWCNKYEQYKKDNELKSKTLNNVAND